MNSMQRMMLLSRMFGLPQTMGNYDTVKVIPKPVEKSQADLDKLAAAEAKRQRRAAKLRKVA